MADKALILQIFSLHPYGMLDVLFTNNAHANFLILFMLRFLYDLGVLLLHLMLQLLNFRLDFFFSEHYYLFIAEASVV